MPMPIGRPAVCERPQTLSIEKSPAPQWLARISRTVMCSCRSFIQIGIKATQKLFYIYKKMHHKPTTPLYFKNKIWLNLCSGFVRLGDRGAQGIRAAAKMPRGVRAIRLGQGHAKIRFVRFGAGGAG